MKPISFKGANLRKVGDLFVLLQPVENTQSKEGGLWGHDRNRWSGRCWEEYIDGNSGEKRVHSF